MPAEAHWEKPQGKNPPLVMKKHFEVVGRGVALVIGCGTFPTWNTYPGLFAALATGNPVIVKPHNNAVLPARSRCASPRSAGRERPDANLVTLMATDNRADTTALAKHPAVRRSTSPAAMPSAAGSSTIAARRRSHAELAGGNNIVIDSTDNWQGMLRNPLTLSLYSGQMHDDAGHLRAGGRHRHAGRQGALRSGRG